MITASICREAYEVASAALRAEALPSGHWEGELAASALSTATAVMTLTLCTQHEVSRRAELTPLIDAGRTWLLSHQNADGGWGDTVLSHSNIATTMLCRATLVTGHLDAAAQDAVHRATAHIDGQGGVHALHARYGRDRTFSVPILTHCALAGLVEWRDITPLPFELACLPHSFYKSVQLPVVSYALPALIAIGQVRHHFQPPRNFVMRMLRDRAIEPSLRKLDAIQPASGGFLEATPLTSFVAMSLIAMGRAEHPVTRRGIEFLVRSVREDGSWPIDTNLATWVTTLAVNGLAVDSLPTDQQRSIAQWLLGQQLRTVHPYTQADPGGWAWTDLSGGVPDADDTPGAILALLKLSRSAGLTDECHDAASRGVQWLLDLQNRDGGWPTFCRGWGALPFDRSSCDITAHALRALTAWQGTGNTHTAAHMRRIESATARGLAYLARQQRADGSWLPLWFGNQFAPHEENPLYGTARVLLAYGELERTTSAEAQRGRDWVIQQQNGDGGWGGVQGAPSSIEETALAVESLTVFLSKSAGPAGHGEGACRAARDRGLRWLIDHVFDGSFRQPSPIGFYFAKLWYFERLYPLVFTVAALRRVCEAETLHQGERDTTDEPAGDRLPLTLGMPE